MDAEEMNVLIGKMTAHQVVLTTLLSEQLKSLSPGDAAVLSASLDPEGAEAPPHPDLGAADHLAGRTMVCQDTVRKILGAAQELAGQGAA